MPSRDAAAPQRLAAAGKMSARLSIARRQHGEDYARGDIICHQQDGAPSMSVHTWLMFVHVHVRTDRCSSMITRSLLLAITPHAIISCSVEWLFITTIGSIN